QRIDRGAERHAGGCHPDVGQLGGCHHWGDGDGTRAEQRDTGGRVGAEGGVHMAPICRSDQGHGDITPK
ncbi:hypothetical protein DKX15_21075, partial [Enterococcus faecium]